MILPQFTKIEFVFKPKKTDTLTSIAKKYIGCKMIGMVGWVQENGVYKDQEIIVGISDYTTDINEFIGWVPKEDCADIKIIKEIK